MPDAERKYENLTACFVALICVLSTAQEADSFDLGDDARASFASKKYPADLPSRAIGTATCGCLAGGKELRSDSPYWQIMRPSRNRIWAHPSLIGYIERLGPRAAKVGWPGLLIGDLSMARGGPMPSGHASHQRGTDVDIWLTPAPRHSLSEKARETLNAASVLKIDTAELDLSIWTPAHADFVRAAAQDENVARVFVTPAIKKYLCACKDKNAADTNWLRRIRPWEGHDDHIHVRLKCPEKDPCVEQEAPPEGDGCGEELRQWLAKTAADPPYKSKAVEENPLKEPFALNKMPAECIDVLNAYP
ncbi:MAG: penicillin-insensitive murein endopeptidase [Candidatus Obscuribacterales bacterium]|nr:penicillin-insensitive murein endopeptidase [Candidatus Obscuribacterales bacterium]